jgi:hypothetical protein
VIEKWFPLTMFSLGALFAVLKWTSLMMLSLGFLCAALLIGDWRRRQARMWGVGFAPRPDDTSRDDNPALFWIFTILGWVTAAILLVFGSLILAKELTS